MQPDSIAERIIQLREKAGLSQNAFAARLGYTQGYLSAIEAGKRPVKPRLINLICLEFNANPAWIAEGRGDIFQQTEVETEEETFRRLLKQKIRALPPEAQDMILELCEDIRAALKDEQGED